jgi:hypothetical protein
MKKNHLQLTSACEGGGVGEVASKYEKKTTTSSLVHAREVE